jgi:hypothetical protein
MKGRFSEIKTQVPSKIIPIWNFHPFSPFFLSLLAEFCQKEKSHRFYFCNSLIFSGEYRNRTDDLLTARNGIQPYTTSYLFVYFVIAKLQLLFFYTILPYFSFYLAEIKVVNLICSISLDDGIIECAACSAHPVHDIFL